MATLRDLKRRIRSISSTAQITKAMEMVAAAKLRRAQTRLFAARPYGRKVSMLLSHLSRAAGMGCEPLFSVRDVRRRTVVAVASNRGLCGSYNGNIIRALSGVVAGSEPEVEVEVVPVGKRVRDFARRLGMNVIRDDLETFDQASVAHAQELASFLMDRFLSGETDEVLILFTSFKSAMSHRLTSRVLLPLERAEEDETHTARDYIFEPSREEVIAELLPRAVVNLVFISLAESFAAEHGARMIAMGAATKNAFDLIDSLTLEMNRARQNSITREIADIVGGAEAMSG
jgi:F-type H+-transporting ATPase subunit gamma